MGDDTERGMDGELSRYMSGKKGRDMEEGERWMMNAGMMVDRNMNG